MRALILLFFLCFVGCVISEDYNHQLDYSVPEEFFSVQGYHPASYLMSFPIENPYENLNFENKMKLAGCLFALRKLSGKNITRIT